MPSSSDFPAHGKIIGIEDASIIFAPSNTNYELKLSTAARFDGSLNRIIEGQISATARKILTVYTGGNFVTPIKGPPRIVQGRIKYLDEKIMVVQAGVPFVLEIPAADTACDLNAGPLAVGAIVNASLIPGARFQLAAVAAAH